MILFFISFFMLFTSVLLAATCEGIGLTLYVISTAFWLWVFIKSINNRSGGVF